MFRCAVCGSVATPDYIEIEKATIGNTQVALVREVPCLRCTECDEIHFTNSVLQLVERAVQESMDNSGIVDEEKAYYNIFDYSDLQDYYINQFEAQGE